MFHTAVVTEDGPDVGISRVVVAYDLENNPRAKDKLRWANMLRLTYLPSSITIFDGGGVSLAALIASFSAATEMPAV